MKMWLSSLFYLTETILLFSFEILVTDDNLRMLGKYALEHLFCGENR